jgi:hypothetical protein
MRTDAILASTCNTGDVNRLLVYRTGTPFKLTSLTDRQQQQLLIFQIDTWYGHTQAIVGLQ